MMWLDKSKGLKESECITYEELIRRNEYKRKLLNSGFRFINKTYKYNKLAAYGLIVIGCITFPFPCGSIFLIGLGVGMLGIKKDSLKRWYTKLIYKIKAKRNNKIK